MTVSDEEQAQHDASKALDPDDGLSLWTWDPFFAKHDERTEHTDGLCGDETAFELNDDNDAVDGTGAHCDDGEDEKEDEEGNASSKTTRRPWDHEMRSDGRQGRSRNITLRSTRGSREDERKYEVIKVIGRAPTTTK
jgi:hypothetical protein